MIVSVTRVDTGMRTLRAEYLTLGNDDGTTSAMTLVWDTRPVHCTPTEPGHIVVGGPERPYLWDSTGTGEWRVADAQCWCGAPVVLTAVVRVGHLDDAGLHDAVREVRSSADRRIEIQREAVGAALSEVVARTRAAIDAGAAVKLRSVDCIDPYEVGITDDGRLSAWAHDPAAGRDNIIVHEEEGE